MNTSNIFSISPYLPHVTRKKNIGKVVSPSPKQNTTMLATLLPNPTRATFVWKETKANSTRLFPSVLRKQTVAFGSLEGKRIKVNTRFWGEVMRTQGKGIYSFLVFLVGERVKGRSQFWIYFLIDFRRAWIVKLWILSFLDSLVVNKESTAFKPVKDYLFDG